MCYICKLTSRKLKSSQRLFLFHRVPPEDRGKAQLAASCVIRAAQAAFCTVCCWYGEPTRQDPPPPTTHKQDFILKERHFLNESRKSCRMRVFDMTALTAREPLLHNEENGTRSKSFLSTAPPPPQLNRSLLVYRVSPQMQRNAAGGRSRSSEYSPRAASSHFLSHESLFPVRLTQPS